MSIEDHKFHDYCVDKADGNEHVVTIDFYKDTKYIEISRNDAYALAKHFGLIDEWVSVDERLPYFGDDVLMLNSMGSMRVGYVLDCGDHVRLKFGSVSQEMNSWEIKVTHWKPLPTPPNGE